MQKLFSQEIRFKQDDGSSFPDWEEKRLAEFCDFFSGGTPKSTNRLFYSGEIPFIGSGNISDKEVHSFITNDALKSSSAKMVNVGDLLYALYGATSGDVAISKISGAINQAVLCIRSNENLNYLYHLLKFNQERIVDTYIQGGQGNLSAKIVKELKFSFPTSEEQTKIANFLSAIDEKINRTQQQLQQTETFKKGLLQKMFV
jgi:type I restriction enzyme S subunit